MEKKKESKTLSLASMELLLRKGGASRCSETAKEALKEILEDLGLEIAEKASRFAQHSGRKTVKSTDIKLAAR